jgi:hypothetical protein
MSRCTIYNNKPRLEIIVTLAIDVVQERSTL